MYLVRQKGWTTKKPTPNLFGPRGSNGRTAIQSDILHWKKSDINSHPGESPEINVGAGDWEDRSTDKCCCYRGETSRISGDCSPRRHQVTFISVMIKNCIVPLGWVLLLIDLNLMLTSTWHTVKCFADFYIFVQVLWGCLRHIAGDICNKQLMVSLIISSGAVFMSKCFGLPNIIGNMKTFSTCDVFSRSFLFL